MPGMDFGLRLLVLRRLIVSGLDGLLGRGFLGHVLKHGLHEQLLAVIGELLCKFGGLFDLIRKCLLRDELAINQKIEDISIAGLAIELGRKAPAQVFRGNPHVLICDLFSVDCRKDFGCGWQGSKASYENKRKRAGEAGGLIRQALDKRHQVGLQT